MSHGVDALRDAVIDLAEARAWVLEHIDLIALTVRQCRVRGSRADRRATPAHADSDTAPARPVLHVFTDDPRAGSATAQSRVAAALNLRVHLLQPLDVAGTRAWHHVPL